MTKVKLVLEGQSENNNQKENQNIIDVINSERW